MDVAKEGYQAYQDPRLAGLTQTEKDAMQQGRDMAGIGVYEAVKHLQRQLRQVRQHFLV